MNETETYIANQIRLNVWSGLTVLDDVQDMITEILEDDADEEILRGLVAQEFERKADAENSWPEVTDCDKLDAAFQKTKHNGVGQCKLMKYSKKLMNLWPFYGLECRFSGRNRCFKRRLP